MHDTNNLCTPKNRDVTYKGWIPNVAGRLSFSVFGYTSIPTKAIVANVSDGNDRFIVCSQERTLIDGALPLRAVAAKLLFGLSGTFWFVCVGTAGDNPVCTGAPLTGDLFLFHRQDLWREEAEPRVRDLQSFLRGYEAEGSALPLAEYCALEYSNLLYKLRETASFFCTYSLDRDGEVLLEPPPIDVLPRHSPRFPSNPRRQHQMIQSVLSQLYFFLRDIGHIHQHHNAKTDTIVDLHECPKNDDYSWRCETLRCLYRKVLEFKRSKHDNVFSNSLGVLAYAKSFEKSSNIKLAVRNDGQVVEPILYTDCLTDSIKANQAEHASRLERHMRRSETFRTSLIAILTFLFALIGLLQLSGVDKNKLGPPSEVLVFLADILLTHPVQIGLFAPAGLLLLLHLTGGSDIPNWRPLRTLLRFASVIGQKKAAFIAITSGIAIGLLTLHLVAPGIAARILALVARMIFSP